MLYAKDFREKAREALTGNWPVAIGTGFVASILGAYTALNASGGSSSSSSDSDAFTSFAESGAISEEIWGIVAIVAVALSFLMIAWAIAMLIIGGPVSLGYARFNLDLVDNNGPMFSDLFSEFRRFGQGFLMNFFRSLFEFLWALLFIIPGIIACYSYAMTPYILCDNPNLTALEAITESKQLMNGNKGRLFCLNFSFIGWDILNIFTFGIGTLWLKPYKEAAYAAFYREIKDAKYSTPEKRKPNVSYQNMPSWDGFDNF